MILLSTLKFAASVSILLAVAAGIVYYTTFRNPARAAGNLLEQSIRAITSLKSVYMVFAIRTSAKENFESIDPSAGFISFKVWKTFGDEPRWKIEKPGRSIIMDGQSQYLINETGGYILQGSSGAGFAGWMKIFLEPTRILESELSYAKSNPSSCTVKEINNMLEMTVKSIAQGDFTNSWALNASIPQANTRRVYSFDKTTHMLKAVSVFIVSPTEDICVLKLQEISIDPPLPDSLFRFSNPTRKPVLTLQEWDKAMSAGIKEINPEEAVRIFFMACRKNEWTTVQRFSPLFVVPGGHMLKIIQEEYGGSDLLQLGPSFSSGMYPGVFVPYLIRTKTGDTISGNLAIRNDNQYHTWNIDGGY
ncbi:MAG: hypothetical protein NTU44_13250 [Bacteroidetes bacterium]|nr:hypothetical protein [Bacteroidota bacterium]